jgi:hypothetical protein
MSYYILPKINSEIIIDPCLHLSMDIIAPHISQSLINYLTKTTTSLNRHLISYPTYTLKFLSQLTNPYEYLFSTIPNTNISVCKIKPTSNIFYDSLEIYNTLKLTECLPNRNMTAFYYGTHGTSVLECMQLVREQYDDNNVLIEPILPVKPVIQPNNILNESAITELMYTPIPDTIKGICDFMYIELPDKIYLDTNKYILGLLKAVLYMLTYQSAQGNIMIRLSHIYYKPVIDILYIISGLYNKVYIIKPSTSNNMNGDRYLVCKTFTNNLRKVSSYLEKIDKIYTICYRERNEINIQSIVKNEINMYFLNKIEECNIIIGQQQIDVYDQMINLIKNKNKQDKIESIQKHNIQKCMHWCEKYKLPYNKFADRANIFLPISAYDNEYMPNMDISVNNIDHDDDDEYEPNLNEHISKNSIVNMYHEEEPFENILNKDLIHEMDYGE